MAEAVELSPVVNRQARINTILLLAGQFVSLLGSVMYSFAIGLYVLREMGSGLNFATTLTLSTLPHVFLGPLAGTIADRIDRKRMVVLMDILSGVVVLALFFVSLIDGLKLPYIYATAFLLATCSAFFHVSLEASIPNLVDDRRLMRVNSLFQSINSTTRIIGPVLGGAVFALIDIRIFLLFNGLSFIISGISESFIDFKLNVADRPEDKNSFFNQLKDGFNYLRQREILVVLFSAAFFINFFFNFGFSVPLPHLVNNIIGLTSQQYGLIAGFFPGGVLLGSLILSRLPEFKKKYKPVMAGLLAMSFGLFLCGLPGIPLLENLSHNYIFIYYLFLMLLMGIFNPVVNVPVIVMLQRETPDHYRGRVMGLVTSACMAISPVAFMLSGFLIELIPVYIVIMVAGCCLLFLCVKLINNKVVKNF